MKKLPIGLNSFEKIRTENYVYVDKTKDIYNLVEGGSYYFLSRPRRFGKTLTIDTLKCLFEGKKELFEGLYIYDKWNWNETNPVIRIDFSVGLFSSKDSFLIRLNQILKEHQNIYGVECESKEFVTCFYELILKISQKYNKQVVLLIDEYDKPILDNIENPPLAEEIRDMLSNFYGVIKGLDYYLRFVMLTGVSKFSKVNLFSKLNNLTDLTIHPAATTLCGYTEEELDIFFSEHLKGADREKIKRWYNGYSWLGERVYNPYDILLFIDNGFRFRPYWFETGTPTFLMKLIKEKKYFIPNLEEVIAADDLLNSFDVYTMEIEALLWQTGYLTIKEEKQIADMTYYLLGYPNLEVKRSLTNSIFKYLTSIQADTKSRLQLTLQKCLEKGDVECLIEEFKKLFSSIPYTNFTKNEIANYEGYYASVIYSFLASLGVDLIAEDITNKGRIDLTVLIDNKAYIIEFKVGKEDALKQIEQRGYHQKYKGKEIYLIGLNFSEEEKNITTYKWKRV